MKKLPLLAILCLAPALAVSACWKPNPADLETISISVTIGQTRPEELISVLGNPSSIQTVSGSQEYKFTFYRSILRLFVDAPGSDNDRIMMIDGAEDPLHAIFDQGVLTNVY
jgi:hypothetical protein